MPPVTDPRDQAPLDLTPEIEARLVLAKALYPGHIDSFARVKQTRDPSKERMQINTSATDPATGHVKKTFPSAIDCSLEKFSGSKVPQWLRNLGFDPATISVAALNAVCPIKCMLELDVEERQDRAGHAIKDNVVTDILGA